MESKTLKTLRNPKKRELTGADHKRLLEMPMDSCAKSSPVAFEELGGLNVDDFAIAAAFVIVVHTRHTPQASPTIHQIFKTIIETVCRLVSL